MNNMVRLTATAVVWIIMATVLTLLQHTNDLVWIALILAAAAAISTAAVWSGPNHTISTQQIESAKHKRNSRMTRLVDALDEDQMYELEELLAARRDERLMER